MDLGLGRLQHQSTSEEKHGRLLKRGSGQCQSPMTSEERQWILQDLSLQCHSSS